MDQLMKSLEEFVILKGFRGSIAHETFQEDITRDDKDIMGIFIPPPNVLFGLDKMETIERMFDEKVSQKKTVTWDIVYYSLPKYLHLILKQNPNVLSLLWLKENYYLTVTSFGKKLIEAREQLLTRQCYDSFCGYARSQLHRMTHQTSTGRLGKKRKELVERFGYDVKNASHLIRLLKMGSEALSLGRLIVARPDNSMLLEIKRGEWSLEKVEKYADELFSRLDEAMIHSPLPTKPNRSFINHLCQDIMQTYYGIQ